MRCQFRWFWIAMCCLVAFRGQAARNVTISSLPTANGSFSLGVFTPTADNANVSTNDITALLGSGVSVTITTGITGTQAGNITVTNPIAPPGSAAASLMLNAAGSVSLNASVALNGSQDLIVSASGPVSQTLAGTLSVGGTASFSSATNSITLVSSNRFLNAVSVATTGTNDVTLRTYLPLTVGVSSIGRNLSLFVPGGSTLALAGNITAGGSISLQNSTPGFLAAVGLMADTALTVGSITLPCPLIGNGHTLTTSGSVVLNVLSIEAVNSRFDFQNSFSFNIGSLNIKDWNGNPAGGGASQIFASNSVSGLSSNQLAQVYFVAPNGALSRSSLATILNTGELVPGPLPSDQAHLQGPGWALNFAAASNQFVQIPDAAGLMPPKLTLEAWVNPHIEKCACVLSRGSGSDASTDWILEVGYDGTNCGVMKLAFFGAGIWDATTNTVSTNVWTHVAVTYDGTNKQFYINGVPDASVRRTNGLSQSGSPIYIGRQGTNCNCNFFDGEIDEVRVWNLARSAAQIQTGYRRRFNIVESGLVAYYHMDEGSGTTLFDAADSHTASFGPGTNAPTWVRAGEGFGLPLVTGLWTFPIGMTSATVNGIVNPEGQPTGAWFLWGPTSSYGSSTAVTNVGSGTNGISVSATLTGNPGDTIYYVLTATNSSGPSSGPSFASTLPGVTLAAQFSATSNVLILSWANPAATLQSATNVSGPYSDLPFVSSPYTNAIGSAPARFFRFRE